jgi:hypothetical protein
MQSMPLRPTLRPGAQWRAIPWLAAICLLAVPWVAMRYTDEVRWTASDFVVGGALLFGLAALVDQALWRPASLAWRAGALLAVVTGFGLAWGTLAAGLIGDEGHPANLGVAGVLAIAAFGTAFARLEARGMARALTATALAQVLVAGLALALGDANGAGVSLLFAGAWAVSALLFRRAAVVAAAKAH